MRSQRLTRFLSRFLLRSPLRRRLWLASIALLTALLCIIMPPLVRGVTASVSLHQAQIENSLEQQGRKAYEIGDYAEAAELFEQAATQYESAGQTVRAALALANLSLSQQQVGRWTEARAAADSALALVPATDNAAVALWAARGEILAIQGQLAFSQGNNSDAIALWAEAATAYDRAGQSRNAVKYQIAQARALQTAGFYDRALALVEEALLVNADLEEDEVTVDALRTYGDLLRLNGQGELAETKLQGALALVETLELPSATSAVYTSLGRLAEANGDREAALNYYQLANEITPSGLAAQVNQLNLLVARSDWGAIATLLPMLTEQLHTQSATRETVYTRLTFADILLDLRQAVDRALDEEITFNQGSTSPAENSAVVSEEEISSGSEPEDPKLEDSEPDTTLIESDLVSDLQLLTNSLPSGDTLATLLLETYTSALELNDTKAQAYSLAILGRLYIQTEQWAIARQQTLDALSLAQGGNFPDVEYQLQEQLCQILQNTDSSEQINSQQLNSEAIKACRAAVDTTNQLRNDIAAKGADAAFDFQKTIEPVYRNFVDLLLKTDQTDKETYQANLREARQVLESLQTAELDNFFREACLEVQSFTVDDIVDEKTAVIYPIILENRLEIILSLADKITHYSVTVSQSELDTTINTWASAARVPVGRGRLTNFNSRDTRADFDVEFTGPDTSETLRAASQQLYQWLIVPIEPDLTQATIDTLVFVPDGNLRNISMAALYDGQQYLIEKYAVALTPGLQLLDPKPITRQKLRAFLAGVSRQQEEFPEFQALEGVETELQTIRQIVDSDVFLNEAATTKALETKIATSSAPIVHIATHGQFGSNADETFIVAWKEKLTVNQLSELLKTSELSRAGELELLILSACETAEGDERAALGLAGVATRSGARSTLATLWEVNDASTAELMSEFYKNLAASELTKAKALQQAQLAILNNPAYEQPYFWSPFVLLGNWL